MITRTAADIALARIYFELLVAFARTNPGETILYSELVAKAKEAYPENAFVAGAIPVSAGRRLDALRDFAQRHGVPDLSALVVSKSTGDNGAGFLRTYNGDVVRSEIARFDWDSLALDFERFMDLEVEALKGREVERQRPKTISEHQALVILWEYYAQHKGEVGALSHEEKDRVVQSIRRGLPPGEALRAPTE